MGRSWVRGEGGAQVIYCNVKYCNVLWGRNVTHMLFVYVMCVGSVI